MKQKLFLLLASTALIAACDSAPNSQIHTSATHEHAAGAEAEAAEYTCPMHPHYIATDPDGSCPICGMNLVPVSANTDAAVGDGSIAVSSEMIQTMGVRLAEVEMASFGRSVRAFGNVETNERLETVSVARLEGWIENLAVTAEGDTVRRGQLLYRVYSPDLVAAQKDYLNSVAIGNTARISAVRQRLISLGMQETAVQRLTETQSVIERVPVYAEAGGTVDELAVRGGDYIRPGTPIMTLQSYADVWVIASIPEQDLALVDTGAPVELSFPSAPDAQAEGSVDYIYPTIDAKTRTAKVRVEVDNSSGTLRPGAYADLRFNVDHTNRLSIPSEAVLRDGRGQHVVIALGDGRFAGRAVRTGVTSQGRTEVLAGLTPGDRVVASGQFLLDSEVNLREGLAKFEVPSALPAGPDTPLSQLPVDATTLAQIDHYTDMALYFHEALRDQYKIDPYFVDPALELGDSLKTQFANTQLVPILEDATSALRVAKDVREGDALATELARLMSALEPWLLEGAPVHYSDAGLTLFRETASGHLWVQEGETPRNPYGAGNADIIPWPDPMAGLSTDVSSQRRSDIDPHAGHR